MFIDAVDRNATLKLKRKFQRSNREEHRPKRQQYETNTTTMSMESNIDEEMSSCETSQALSDEEFRTHDEWKTTVSLPRFSLLADRFGISDRAAASLANGLFADIQFSDDRGKIILIDRCKIRRERSKLREKLKVLHNDEIIDAEGLYFDSKKDKTMNSYFSDDNIHDKYKYEEHLCLVKEPGSSYLSYLCPSSSKANHVAESIIEYIEEKNISSSVKVIGCDSTVVNTGSKNGIIHKLELFLGRPLQHAICMLHTNELPLRKLVTHLFGQTKGPRSFENNFHNELSNCEQLPICNFRVINPIETMQMTEEVRIKLSKDQEYLYTICTVIATKTIPDGFQNRKCGPLNHARWVTMACRICRLYIGSVNPSCELEMLVNFIVTNYALNWFDIKCHSDIFSGPKLFHRSIVRLRNVAQDNQEILRPVLQRNSYFAHPENIVLSMLSDTCQEIRTEAINLIKMSRDKRPELIREFRTPTISFSSESWTKMVNLTDYNDIEPPLTRSLQMSQIESFRESPYTVKLFPNHNQAVERVIKIISEASCAVGTQKSRHGLILSKLSSQAIMPRTERKCDFNVMLEKY